MTNLDFIKIKAYLKSIEETAGELLYAMDNDKDFPMKQDIVSVESITHSSIQVQELLKSK